MRLKFQVERVLQMAIFERIRMKLNLVDRDVHTIIEKAVDNFTLQIGIREGEIRKDFQASESFATVDEIHLLNAIRQPDR